MAALAVAFFHFTAQSTDPFRHIGTYGALGVPAFFVISGFVITLSLSRSGFRSARDAPVFMARRLLRLEPAYIGTVFLTVGLLFLASPFNGLEVSPNVIPSIPWHFAYLVPWTQYGWLNPVFWTLAIEFPFYLAMLVLAPHLLTRDTWRMRGVLIALLLISIVAKDNRLLSFHLPLFGVGFAVALYCIGRITRYEAVAWAIVFAIGGLAAVGWQSMAIGLATGALILAPLRSEVPLLSAAGAMSYSIYLLHVPIGVKTINLLNRLPDSLPMYAAKLSLALLLTIVASYAMWRWVEMPSIRLAKWIEYRN